MVQIPKNVMQIGQSNPHCKVYMEDYVHTFLRQRKKEEIYLAFGKKEEVDGVRYYLIYGAEKKTDWDRGSMPYFKKYERLGTLEGTPDKRIFRPLRQDPVVLDGYFIFYEQNEDMQSYMITVREKEDMQHEREAEKEAVIEAVRVRREAGREQRRESMQSEADGGTKQNEQTFFRKRERTSKAKRRFPERRLSAAVSKQRTRTERKPWTVLQICRAASLCLLLLLAATGVTSVNQTADLKKAGQLLGDAVHNIRLSIQQSSEQTLNDTTGAFIIEETQIETAETYVLDVEKTETADADMVVTDATVTNTGSLPQENQSTEKIQWTIDMEADKEESESETAAVDGTDGQAQDIAEDIQATETIEETIEENVPENAEAFPVADRPESYVVKRGDSLAEICRRFYGDTSRLYEICSINRIKDPNQIRYGQNILLP